MGSSERVSRARRRLEIELAGFRASERAAADYGARMASLGRYRRPLATGAMDRGKLVAAFAEEYMVRAGAADRLRAAREWALDEGVGPAVIEEVLRGAS